MDEHLKLYIDSYKLTEDSFNLDEDDLEIEKELAEAFYGVEEKSRMKLLKKIPLGILYRIRECKHKLTGNPTSLVV